MQNIDYSRKLRSGKPLGESYSPTLNREMGLSPMARTGKPTFILLIGAILLFTAGMVVGIQVGQKESQFQVQGSSHFSNLGKDTKKTPDMPRETSTKEEPQEPNPPASNSNGSPSSLKFPPKNDQINYMVLVGDFSPQEALHYGKQLVEAQPNLQGRIFRTSTGRLFAGYFYRLEDAKEAMQTVRSRFPELTGLEVKTIRF